MSAAPLKVLVIDDEPPIRKLLRMGLSTQGYEILFQISFCRSQASPMSASGAKSYEASCAAPTHAVGS
jgi:CheY-like chemotaxis protein